MPINLIRQIRDNASHLACGNILYDWSLKGDVPDRLNVKPTDPWAGNAEAGRWQCDGAFSLGGDQLSLRGGCWEPVGVDGAWLDHMHGFEWLRDLRALGGEEARQQALWLTESWIHYHPRWSSLAWRVDLCGSRIAMWISHFEFFVEAAGPDFQDIYFESLTKQARHLSRSLPGASAGVGLLKGIKGLLYAGLALEGREAWIDQALNLLNQEIGKQVLRDGAHVSRSPVQHLQALQIFLDVRTALNAAARPMPESVQHAIDNLGAALRFFRYGDGGLGVFHGTQEGSRELLDAVLSEANVRGKGLQSLPCAGFEKMSHGRTLVMLDCGRSPPWPHDRGSHAAPLAFEMAYGKERVFVSCGTHPTNPDWRDALRATAAHNTVSLDYRNACEIRADGHFSRKPRTVSAVREETKDGCFVEASHDGYALVNGIEHRRRLYLSDQGNDLRGEDVLMSQVALARPVDVAVRFHIHPRVMASMTSAGDEVLLRLPSGIGWRFHQSGGALKLEDSIYLGEGSRPRKTKQIVIHAPMAEGTPGGEFRIKWAMQREGI
ncbi:MAG: heparinase II/III family protein [Alphaproteobacteria bacterium]